MKSITNIERIVWLNSDVQVMFDLNSREVQTLARVRRINKIANTYFWRKKDIEALAGFVGGR